MAKVLRSRVSGAALDGLIERLPGRTWAKARRQLAAIQKDPAATAALGRSIEDLAARTDGTAGLKRVGALGDGEFLRWLIQYVVEHRKEILELIAEIVKLFL